MRIVGYSVEEMQNKANEILEKNKETDLPIDIIRILKNNDFGIFKMKLPDEMTGALLVNDNGLIGDTGLKKLIIVDNEANTQRGKFICAHEFGHYILHKKDNEPLFAHRDYSHSSDLCEKEADLFARSILMPLGKLLFEINNNIKSINDIEDLTNFISAKFQVTKNKANDRIWDLSMAKKIEIKENGSIKVCA